MIRHRNYYAMVSVIDHLPGYVRDDDLMLLYLPLAHNFGRLMHLTGPYVGYTIAFLPDPLQTAEALLTVRPTVLPSVPRVYEKIHTAVVAAMDETTGVKRRLADWSLAVGREVGKRQEAGRPVGRRAAAEGAPRRPARLREDPRAARRTPADADLGRRAARPGGGRVLRRDRRPDLRGLRPQRVHDGRDDEHAGALAVRDGRARRCPGSSSGSPRTASSCSAATRSSAATTRIPTATAEVLDADGWLHTGDIAEIDDDGFVKITDRKKDIIVTAGGKNIAPQNLENDLKASKYVSQAIVVGDRRPFPAALVTLDEVEVAKWAAAQGFDGDTAALAADPRVIALVQGVVDDVNRERSRYEQIKKFVILPRDFTMEQDEVTPTLKLKRRAIMKNFADAVDGLYEP